LIKPIKSRFLVNENIYIHMTETLIQKKGYYSIFKITKKDIVTFKVDSGKTIYLARFHKYIINPYRDVEEFKTLDMALKYVKAKLSKKTKQKKKILKKLPKSLYLVLIREEKSNEIFVKVGFTSKKFIYRRFSKIHGYDGYTLETILRRVDTPFAEKLEKEIKDKIQKKRSIKKYRPLLESFSGYSECFNYKFIDEIIKIFDDSTNLN
jgi:nitrogenase molybdenum-iron protein alpha/beta subunit